MMEHSSVSVFVVQDGETEPPRAFFSQSERQLKISQTSRCESDVCRMSKVDRSL